MIDIKTYINITCYLEQSYNNHVNIYNSLSELTPILDNTIGTQIKKISMTDAINSATNTIGHNVSTNDNLLLSAVKALQVHVTKYYGSVNSFLHNNNVKVNSYFANISSLVGYPINTSNIKETC
jgi:hypothetical protein